MAELRNGAGPVIGLTTLVGAVGVKVPSSPLALFVGVVLAAASVPVSRHVVRVEGNARLANLVLASALLHLLAAPAQIFVVDHVYHGVADWLRYDHQGALLAHSWRSGHFTLAHSGVTRILGDGSVSIATGVVMTVVGADQLAAFFVFAWLAFLGCVCFLRAFSITFPGADRRRYQLLVLFFPSLLFWTADASKEAVMMLSLGVAAYGMARVLARLRGGYPLVLVGSALGLWVRPNELVLLVVGFVLAMLLRAPDFRSANRPLRRAGSLVFVAAVVVVSGAVTSRFLHAAGGSGVIGTLSHIQQNNQGSGAGFGSSSVSYSANPLFYPRDVYDIVFDPLPITARSLTQLIAAVENSLLLVVILTSLRQLRCLLRAGRRRPYVVVALVYSGAFLYAFAALGNLGLITRERTLLLPLFFVPLAIPLAPRGARPYPWQERHRSRRASASAAPQGDHTSGQPTATNAHGPTTESQPVYAQWQAAGPNHAVWGDRT